MSDDFYEVYRRRLPGIIFNAIFPDEEISRKSESKIIREAKPDALDWEFRLRVNRILKKVEGQKKDFIWQEEDFYKGIASRNVFRQRLDHPYKRHFICMPLHSFEEATDNIITTLTARFYEIASLPLMVGKGENKAVDHKNARLLIDLAKLMLDRKHGKAAQKLQIETKGLKEIRSPKEIEAEILALEAEFDESEPGEISKGAPGKKENEGVAAVSDE